MILFSHEYCVDSTHTCMYTYACTHSTWMDGPMSGVDPDQVENETGILWRTLYKLEKGFQDNPNPLKIAKKVHFSSKDCPKIGYY